MRRGILNSLMVSSSFVLLFSSCQSTALQTKVSRLEDAGLTGPSGLVYALPRTAVRVSIEVTKYTEKRGPFFEYRERYLSIPEGISADRVRWEISGIDINTYSEPDPGEYYVVESDGIIESNYLVMSRAGLVLSTEAGLPEEMGTIRPVTRTPGVPLFFPDRTIDYNNEINLEWSYTIQETDSGFVRVPYNYEKVSWKSLEEKAAEAADVIVRIRKRRAMLLGGMTKTYPDGKALEIALSEMDRMEKEYLALFTGKTLKESFVVEYDVVPTLTSIQKATILCRFSEDKGVLPEGETGGVPVALDIRPESLTPPLSRFGGEEEGAESENKALLVYRVPDVALLRVTTGLRTLASKRAQVYQLGSKTTIPAGVRLYGPEMRRNQK